MKCLTFISKNLLPKKSAGLLLSAAVCTLLVTGLLSGCSRDNGGGVPVRGSVTLDGAPLPKGTISFHDELGTTIALGLITNGKYSMDQSSSYHGVPPGKYGVSFLSWIERPGVELPDGRISPGVSRIPEKYMLPTSSGYTADIGSSGENMDFSLQSNNVTQK